MKTLNHVSIFAWGKQSEKNVADKSVPLGFTDASLMPEEAKGFCSVLKASHTRKGSGLPPSLSAHLSIRLSVEKNESRKKLILQQPSLWNQTQKVMSVFRACQEPKDTKK